LVGQLKLDKTSITGVFFCLHKTQIMSLELALIVGFLCHLIGDYLIQDNWMAQNKGKYIHVAIVHGLSYSIGFLILFCCSSNPLAMFWLSVLAFTHIIIDHYDMATYWIMFRNWSWGTS